MKVLYSDLGFSLYSARVPLSDLPYLTLKCARGAGPRKLKVLLEHFGSADAVLSADAKALLEIEGVGPSLVRALNEAKSSIWPKEELARVQALGLSLLHLNSPLYPESLRAIYDPPTLLYVRGELPEFNSVTPRSVGVVGTRGASEYALHFTKTLAQALAEAKVTVVSGLALGVDSAAHRGSLLPPHGKTIAVLGSGVDVVYPKQNRDLAKKIASGRGAVVSEYPVGTRPDARNFPGRNRIINGLSRGVVVVEAGNKSGALITADYALEEGRTVFAVPGRVGDPRSSGTHKLLKQGARLIENAQDIFDEFAWTQASSPKAPDLNELETALVKRIQDLGEPLLDDLNGGDPTRTPAVLTQLAVLELKGVVKQLPGGRYACLVSL